MAEQKPCARCKANTPSNDNIAETTFWGFFTTKVSTITERTVRLRAHYFRRNPKRGASSLIADEEQPLCSDCWGLLIGWFLQGRSVDALPGKEGR